jgi:hypothetical protein
MKLISLHTDNFYKDPKLEGFVNNVINLQNLNINYKLYVGARTNIPYIDLKVSRLLSVLKQYDPEEIILYLDSYDTLVLEKNLDLIEQKFSQFNCDILFASEVKLNPQPQDENKQQAFFNYFLKDKYLNAGASIFKNSKFIELLEIMNNLDIKSMSNNDQYIWQMMYALTQKINISIKLDENNEIFQCLSSFPSSEVGPIFGEDSFYNPRTNTYPSILHGQGMDGYRKLIQFSIKSNRYWTDVFNNNSELQLKNSYFYTYLESLKSALNDRIITLKIYREGKLKHKKDIILLSNNIILHLDDFHSNEYYYYFGLNHIFICDKDKNITSLYDISSFKKNSLFKEDEIKGYFYWDIHHSSKLWTRDPKDPIQDQTPAIYIGPARS